jgi:hypothetical protein
MFSVLVCVCVFLCLCTGRGLATSWSPAQGVLPTVPDQETEETQPHAPKAGASFHVWEQRGRKKLWLLNRQWCNLGTKTEASWVRECFLLLFLKTTFRLLDCPGAFKFIGVIFLLTRGATLCAGCDVSHTVLLITWNLAESLQWCDASLATADTCH